MAYFSYVGVGRCISRGLRRPLLILVMSVSGGVFLEKKLRWDFRETPRANRAITQNGVARCFSQAKRRGRPPRKSHANPRAAFFSRILEETALSEFFR